ncbi:MAG TPA: hypothetical protein VMH22_12160 [bacterium]|nr:hypothetical protein [bacterium]
MKNLVFRSAIALALLFLACDQLLTNEFQPSGTQFNINSNINVISITGSPDLSPYGPFTMGMTIASRSSGTATDVLPAGLLLKRRVNNTQHMLLLKPQSVAADTAGSTVLLGVFCCNKNRPSPDAGDTFDIGPVTDNSDLLQIVGLVQHKDISSGSNMWIVQRAVYMVTDSTGLTQAYIDSLNALPAETTD